MWQALWDPRNSIKNDRYESQENIFPLKEPKTYGENNIYVKIYMP